MDGGGVVKASRATVAVIVTIDTSPVQMNLNGISNSNNFLCENSVIRFLKFSKNSITALILTLIDYFKKNLI